MTKHWGLGWGQQTIKLRSKAGEGTSKARGKQTLTSSEPTLDSKQHIQTNFSAGSNQSVCQSLLSFEYTLTSSEPIPEKSRYAQATSSAGSSQKSLPNLDVI